MICRNCGTELPDNTEKCYHCHKDPKKRNYRGRAGAFLVALIIIAAAAIAAVALKPDEVRSLVGTRLPSEAASVYAVAKERVLNLVSSFDKTESESTKVGDSSTSESVASPLSAATIQKVSVRLNESDSFSSRGLLKAEKAEWKKASQADFKSFCEQKISGSADLWTTVEFEDGTGLVFTESCTTSAVYCKLDENGHIATPLALIVLSQSGDYICHAKNDNKEENESLSAAKQTDAEKQTKESKTGVTLNKNTLGEKEAKSTTDKTTAETSNNEHSKTVYITASGSKYHKAGCSSLSKSKKAISLSEAKKQGYEPCKRCWN